jgi:hypothetical protein
MIHFIRFAKKIIAIFLCLILTLATITPLTYYVYTFSIARRALFSDLRRIPYLSSVNDDLETFFFTVYPTPFENIFFQQFAKPPR